MRRPRALCPKPPLGADGEAGRKSRKQYTPPSGLVLLNISAVPGAEHREYCSNFKTVHLGGSGAGGEQGIVNPFSPTGHLHCLKMSFAYKREYFLRASPVYYQVLLNKINIFLTKTFFPWHLKHLKEKVFKAPGAGCSAARGQGNELRND